MAQKTYSKHHEYRTYSTKGNFEDGDFESMKTELLPSNYGSLVQHSNGGPPGNKEFYYEYKEEKNPQGTYDRKDLRTVEQYEFAHAPSNIPPPRPALPASHITTTTTTRRTDLTQNIEELDSLLDDLQKDQERKPYKSGYSSDTMDSSSFDYRTSVTPVKSSGYSSLSRVEKDVEWIPAVQPTTIAREVNREIIRNQVTESHVGGPQSLACDKCHPQTVPMNKVTTTVKTYTYEVPADTDPSSLPIPVETKETQEYHTKVNTQLHTSTPIASPSRPTGPEMHVCPHVCPHTNTTHTLQKHQQQQQQLQQVCTHQQHQQQVCTHQQQVCAHHQLNTNNTRTTTTLQPQPQPLVKSPSNTNVPYCPQCNMCPQCNNICPHCSQHVTTTTVIRSYPDGPDPYPSHPVGHDSTKVTTTRYTTNTVDNRYPDNKSPYPDNKSPYPDNKSPYPGSSSPPYAVPADTIPKQPNQGPPGSTVYKYTTTNYSYNSSNSPNLGGERPFPTDHQHYQNGPRASPFPRTESPAPRNQEPPKRLDDLLADFPGHENYPPDNDGLRKRPNPARGPGGAINGQMVEKVTVQNQASKVNEQKANSLTPSKNIAGPPVYYPPGQEMFSKKGEAAAYQQSGGGYMKQSGKYKYEAESSSKSKSSSGAAVVPVCLPLCCAMPCTIL